MGTPDSQPAWERLHRIINQTETVRRYGRVNQVVGLVVEAAGPSAGIGEMCRISVDGEKTSIPAEVVGFRDNKILLMPLGELRGIEPGRKISPTGSPAQAQVGKNLLGRVLDALGTPIDGKGPVHPEAQTPLYAPSTSPILRRRISQPIDVGVRAINALLTIGKGQRMAIFSGSGVGKSTLLGMMARHTAAEVRVIALIGERGREVREFIEKDLGREGLERSVLIVATSDQHPLLRMRGAYLATAIAEYFRDRGKDVLFMMDSITRFAMASREVGLAVGEPPTAKGYTPSVFSQLPKLLERAGTTPHAGSITGIYTVLVEGDDLNDPIADAVRSIADGHIVLSRELANRGHYPAIDILASISRVMPDIVRPEQMDARRKLVAVLAVYQKSEDLINIGAYVMGSSAQIDHAIKKMPEINNFLRQPLEEKVSHPESFARLTALFKE